MRVSAIHDTRYCIWLRNTTVTVWTAEELLRQHVDLRPEEVYAALTYFYDHFDAMVAELKASFTAIEAKRPPQPFSRSELLQRKAALGN